MLQAFDHHPKGQDLTTRGSSCGLCCTTVDDLTVLRSGKPVVEKVSLHIHCGEITALVGPNGAGKTTLLKAILGELPHSGSLNYLDAAGERSGKPRIGYVPQRLDFDLNSPVSVMDLFQASSGWRPTWLFPSRRWRGCARDILARVQAEHLLDRRLGALSGGELQRVLLALALDPIPDLLLLDEPISGVDYKGMQLFYNIVGELKREYDLSIILVSHDLPVLVSLADRVVFLNRTIQSIGSPAEVLNHPGFLQAFGLDARALELLDGIKIAKKGRSIDV